MEALDRCGVSSIPEQLTYYRNRGAYRVFTIGSEGPASHTR